MRIENSGVTIVFPFMNGCRLLMWKMLKAENGLAELRERLSSKKYKGGTE